MYFDAQYLTLEFGKMVSHSIMKLNN